MYDAFKQICLADTLKVFFRIETTPQKFWLLRILQSEVSILMTFCFVQYQLTLWYYVCSQNGIIIFMSYLLDWETKLFFVSMTKVGSVFVNTNLLTIVLSALQLFWCFVFSEEYMRTPLCMCLFLELKKGTNTVNC
jgi:hypothetical protein